MIPDQGADMQDQSGYPIVYHPARRSRLFGYAGSLLPLVPAVVLLSNLLTGRLHGIGATFFIGVLGLGLLAASGAVVLATATYKLTLELDAISWRSAFAGRRMQRRDIAGYRRLSTRGGAMIFLSAQPGVPPLRLVGGMATDERFDQWLQGLADLGAAGLKSPASSRASRRSRRSPGS
jgi:hypothetical protein